MAKKIIASYRLPGVHPLRAVKPVGKHPLRHTVRTNNGGLQSNYVPCGLCGDNFSPKAQKRGGDWAFALAACQSCSANGQLAKAGLRRYAEFVAKYGEPTLWQASSKTAYIPGGWNVAKQGLLPSYPTLMKYAVKHFGKPVGLRGLADAIKNDPQLV